MYSKKTDFLRVCLKFFLTIESAWTNPDCHWQSSTAYQPKIQTIPRTLRQKFGKHNQTANTPKKLQDGSLEGLKKTQLQILLRNSLTLKHPYSEYLEMGKMIWIRKLNK